MYSFKIYRLKGFEKYIHVCNLYSSQDSKYSPHSSSLELLCGLLCYPTLTAGSHPCEFCSCEFGVIYTFTEVGLFRTFVSDSSLSFFWLIIIVFFSNLKNRCLNSQRL